MDKPGGSRVDNGCKGYGCTLIVTLEKTLSFPYEAALRTREEFYIYYWKGGKIVLNSKRKTVIISCLLICLNFILPAGTYAAEKQAAFTLTVIHTNDFHDYDPYALARKATLIKQIRAKSQNVLLLDAGDLYTRGKYHENFYGEMEMAAYNAMKYDAWELGNNEFKGHPNKAEAEKKVLNLVKQAKFPTLCANIKTTDGKYLPGVSPYFVKNVNGVRIGIIGVSSLKVKGYPQAADKLVEDPVTAVKELIPQVKEQSDIQIVLSHAGLAADATMDKQLADSGISLIVGADDHYVIERPIYRSGGIPIVQAGGEDNIFLGRIDLSFENKNGRWVLVSQQGQLYPITDKVHMDPEIKKIIDQYLTQVKKTAA